MKLYGLFVVQNEGDIIRDILEFLKKLNVYEVIFFYDLGSSDDTFNKALEFKDILCNPQVLNQVYTNQLRYDLLASHADVYREGDWVSIIDADEFYVDDPKQWIQKAESENATCLKTYQADFLFTDLDLKNFAHEDTSLPVFERRKHYLIRWSEERFYKYLPGQIFSNSKPCSVKLLNRHYPYRSPEQIRRRIQTRLENKKKAQNLTGRSLWLQIYSENWKDYVVPQRILHRYDGSGFHFGIPEGVQWKDYYSSKNPFSYAIPEVATALLSDKKGTEIVRKTQDGFGSHVKQEIRNDLSAEKWKSATIGMSVLIRFYFRVVMKFISLKYFCGGFRINLFVRNCLRGLRRALSGKSAGYLIANPNPILLPDISEAGETTLSWRCFHTSAVEVHVGSPDGPLLSRSGSSGVATTGKWVLDQMVFFLQDVSDQLPLTAENTIAKVPVVLLPAVFQVPPINKTIKDVQ